MPGTKRKLKKEIGVGANLVAARDGVFELGFERDGEDY